MSPETEPLLRLAKRYRPFIILVATVLVIAVFPAVGSVRNSVGTSSSAGGAGGGSSSGGLVSQGGTVPGGRTGTTLVGSALPSQVGGSGAVGGSGSGVGGAAPGQLGNGSSSVTSLPAGPSLSGPNQVDGGTVGAGIDSARALAQPDCDSTTKRIRIVFAYAPPCVDPWAVGSNNGGATAQGVTGTTIKVVLYNQQGGEAGVGPTAPDSEALQDFQYADAAFEHFYQLWGRHVVATVVDQTGADEVSQRADAITIESQHPFAVLTVTGDNVPILVDSLAQHGIEVISDTGITVKQTLADAPYVWGDSEPADEEFEYNDAIYVSRRLMGHNAQWAGEADYLTKPRKFGLVYPTIQDPSVFDNEFTRLGGRLTDQVSYVLGTGAVSQEAEKAQTIITRFKSEGVTSVILDSDFLINGQLTNAAASQGYFPEWIITGYQGSDIDTFAKTNNPAEQRHAFGIGSLSVYGGAIADVVFFNWYYGAGSNQAQNADDTIDNFYLGLNNAGPDLTPATFQAGLFDSPPVSGALQGQVLNPGEAFGNHGFYPWTAYTAWDDWTEIYWDPSAAGEDNVFGANQVGNYRYLNGGRRYLSSQWPTGQPAMFNPSGTVVSYSTTPPSDTSPSYQCKGCPSS